MQDLKQARRLRLRAQRLDVRRPDEVVGVAQVVKELCGVQAQDPSAAGLMVRARSAGLLAADVERARVRERSVVRTWCLRGTLHLLAAEDLGWLLPLLGPIFIRASRHRYAELGLDVGTGAQGVGGIRDALANRGPLSRNELVEQLASRGIRVAGQAAYHLVRRAALDGHVCLGPDRDGEATYVLLDDWAVRGPGLSREAAQAELARRYLAAYSPAGPDDLAAWSGLSLGEARAGWERIADELLEVDIAGRPAWLLKRRAAWLEEPPADSPIVRLLPSFDSYLLGYRDRDLAVAPQYAKRIHPGGGLLRPTLLIDGQALGTWRSRRRRDRLEVVVEPFEEIPREVQSGFEAEVTDLGRFLGVKATSAASSAR